LMDCKFFHEWLATNKLIKSYMAFFVFSHIFLQLSPLKITLRKRELLLISLGSPSETGC
jgi:hypothetical protein